MDVVGTKSSLRLAPAFCWSSWVSSPGSTSCSLPFPTLYFFGQNLNFCVYICRRLDGYGGIITPRLLLSQWPWSSLVTCSFESSQRSALSHFLLKERRPHMIKLLQFPPCSPWRVCGSFLFLSNATDSFPSKDVHLLHFKSQQSAAFVRWSTLCERAHAHLYLYMRSAGGIYFMEAICFCDTWVRWLLPCETKFEWSGTSNVMFVYVCVCHSGGKNVSHATLKCPNWNIVPWPFFNTL